jgi:hypothetical protein
VPTPDLGADIAEQAVDPVASGSDGQTASGRPIGDLIAADKHLAQKRAGRRRLRGVAVTQLITPGTLDDCGRVGSFDQPGGYY